MIACPCVAAAHGVPANATSETVRAIRAAAAAPMIRAFMASLLSVRPDDGHAFHPSWAGLFLTSPGGREGVRDIDRHRSVDWNGTPLCLIWCTTQLVSAGGRATITACAG